MAGHCPDPGEVGLQGIQQRSPMEQLSRTAEHSSLFSGGASLP